MFPLIKYNKIYIISDGIKFVISGWTFVYIFPFLFQSNILIRTLNLYKIEQDLLP